MSDPKANLEAENSFEKLPVTLLLETLKKSVDKGGIKFSFLLGSGASASSEIPTGGVLAEKWYKELEEILTEEDLKAWQEEEKKEGEEKSGLGDPERYAEFYSPIYQKRFGHCPEEGYNELEEIMGDKDPSLGYFILAQIISKPPNNIVLTTNFDNLLEDAVRSYTNKIPFVAGHEFLADYIPSNTKRPVILKLHRDLLLHPRNTKKETRELPEQWKKNLRNILSSSTLIVLGYGGNDGSLMDFLKELPSTKRGDIYWCVRKEEELTTQIKEVLKKDSDRVVLIKDFDEFMYQCGVALGYKNSFNDILRLYGRRFLLLSRRYACNRHENIVTTLWNLMSDEEKMILFSQMSFDKWMRAYDVKSRIEQFEKPDEKTKAYENAISEDPGNEFLKLCHVQFLENNPDSLDEVQKIYEDIIASNPSESFFYWFYAQFLIKNHREKDARTYYEKMIEANLDNPYYWMLFAQYLTRSSETQEAEGSYKRALELAPQSYFVLRNYAIFLRDIRKDEAKANEYFRRAGETDFP